MTKITLPDPAARIAELEAEVARHEARAREAALEAIAAYSQAAEAHNAQLAAQARERALLEALMWCSGSDDFNEGGRARTGWLRICAPLISAAVKEAAQ